MLSNLLRYGLLTLASLPIMVGYLWIVISTFSTETHGLIPVGPDGRFGGLTLENWVFLKDPFLWKSLLNTSILAGGLTAATAANA